MKMLPLIASLFIASSAFAADQYNFKLLGFSKDNKYVAFAQSVVQDGSGHGVAVVSVVDVKANDLVKNISHHHEAEEVGSEEVALKGAIAKANLSKFGIDSKRQGELLLERRPTDASTILDTVFKIRPYMHSTQFSLELKELAAKSDQCYDMGEPKMLKLTLKSKNDPQTVNLVMQEDKVLPRSRGCALGYGVSKVIRSGNALVVIVMKSSLGFEGPDFNFMAVTADINLDEM
jgi:predicted secreted protein